MHLDIMKVSRLCVLLDLCLSRGIGSLLKFECEKYFLLTVELPGIFQNI